MYTTQSISPTRSRLPSARQLSKELAKHVGGKHNLLSHVVWDASQRALVADGRVLPLLVHKCQ